MKKQNLHLYNPKFSQHAESIIRNLKEFDRDEFVKWFLDSPFCVVGTTHVTNYLVEKSRSNKTVKLAINPKNND